MKKQKILILAIGFVMLLTGLIFAFVTLSASSVQRGDNNSILTISTRKGPYLIYPGNPTQMTVLWQLDSTATCTIEWGDDTTYSDGSAQTSEYGSDHQHSYTISNLAPGRLYYYQVLAGNETNRGTFHSAPDSNVTDLKFIAYGDTRSYPSTQNVVAARIISTYTQDTSFQSLILSVGDLVNTGSNESDWDNQFFSRSYQNIQTMLANLPYQATMGNHEGNGLLYAKYFPYPFIGNRYWSFDYGPAHITVIDQYSAYGPGSAQLQWIQNDLASSGKLWKFILLHEPGWSAGGDHENNLSVQNYIQPLCTQYGVSIVFGGHNHYYSRAVVDGVEHITTGGGGAPLYQPNPSYPHIVASAMTNHFCKIEIEGNHLHFAAISSAGVTLDTFSISLGPTCSYVPGDANGNGAANGIDVVYSVNYLKGSGPNPPDTCNCPPHGTFYSAADANGNCAFNGIDVTYMVNFLKGFGQAPRACVDCPPAGK
jgi:hypothetical protein